MPGPFGVGDIGPEAHAFLDFCERAGQRLWQVLPLGPIGHGHSPYSCHSAFAGGPLLISLDALVADGLLSHDDVASPPACAPDRVDFGNAAVWKQGLLQTAWQRFEQQRPQPLAQAFAQFLDAPEQRDWLPDWCLFSALKHRFGGESWTTWPDPIRRREKPAIAGARQELEDEIAYHGFLQFLFFRQWAALHAAARARGMQVLGDLPIYVALDSADVWANPLLFELDEDLRPRAVAGVPPDYFSETGQLWGNPLYRWDRMAHDGFAWWIARLRANLRIADVVRIDHFRAFSGYWQVPAGAQTAVFGKWRKAPGRALFKEVTRLLGDVAIVAEDLGFITPDVERLLGFTGFPRMKVLQFAFGKDDDVFQPHRYGRNCVVYTGTHDNDTSRGWWGSLNDSDRSRALVYLGGDGAEIEWSLVRAAYTSLAERAIVPMQDALGLSSDARMNTPAEPAGNWGWRARREHFSPELAARLRRLAEVSGRV